MVRRRARDRGQCPGASTVNRGVTEKRQCELLTAPAARSRPTPEAMGIGIIAARRKIAAAPRRFAYSLGCVPLTVGRVL